MNLSNKNPHQSYRNRWCENCRTTTHDTNFCRRSNTQEQNNQTRKWCDFHKSRTHTTAECHSKNSVRCVREEDTNFVFTFQNRHQQPEPASKPAIADQSASNTAENFGQPYDTARFPEPARKPTIAEQGELNISQGDPETINILIDSGASVHVINDKNKFTKFEPDFNPQSHVIVIANDQNIQGIAQGQGDAKLTLEDSNGQPTEVILKGALYIPTFSQDILSVSAAANQGASFHFNDNKSTMTLGNNKTEFDLLRSKILYYVNTVTSKKSHTLKEWHNILGHCNTGDILKLESAVYLI